MYEAITLSHAEDCTWKNYKCHIKEYVSDPHSLHLILHVTGALDTPPPTAPEKSPERNTENINGKHIDRERTKNKKCPEHDTFRKGSHHPRQWRKDVKLSDSATVGGVSGHRHKDHVIVQYCVYTR